MITGNATELDLEDVLCDYIRSWICEDRFLSKVKQPDPDQESEPTSKESWTVPIVHPGMIPREVVSGFFDITTIPKWPFILVQVMNWYDAIPEGCIYTHITAGVWDPDERCQGYRGALYLIRKIARKIWFEGLLLNNFAFNPREKTSGRILSSREITHPYYMAEVMVPWQMRTPYIREESDQELANPQAAFGTQTQPMAEATKNNLDTETEVFPVAGWPFNY